MSSKKKDKKSTILQFLSFYWEEKEREREREGKDLRFHDGTNKNFLSNISKKKLYIYIQGGSAKI